MKILLEENFKTETTEYRIVELVNKNPNIFKEKTINEISEILFLNSSSLSRAVKRMGYLNYKEFRDYIVSKTQEISVLKMRNHYDNVEDLINNFKYSNKFAIDETLSSVPARELDLITNLLISKKQIFLYGIGFSNYMCGQLNKHFNLMGINSHNIETFYDALKVINNLNSENINDRVWIIMSKTLTTKEICFILDELCITSIEVILITSNNKSAYFNKAKYKLLLKTLYKDDDVYSLNSKFSALAITNLLIETVGNKLNYNKIDKISSFNERTKKWKMYKKNFNK